MKRKKAPKPRESVYFSEESYAALARLMARYRERRLSDIVSGAVLYLEKQSKPVGLDANCEPIGAKTNRARILTDMKEMVAKEIVEYHAKEGPPDKVPKRPPGKN